MPLVIKIREREAPLTVRDAMQLDEALGQASDEARKHGVLGAVRIEADNGNFITMVVGGQETALGFDSSDLNFYYASKGASDAVEPVMTCYFMMSHHTEFPRKYVIPVADGVKAVHQFLDSGASRLASSGNRCDFECNGDFSTPIAVHGPERQPYWYIRCFR
jgi:Immunity protein Imm1